MQCSDAEALQALVHDWVVFSDGGFWDEFRALWHDDGRMEATWTSGTADDFVEMRKKVFENQSMGILHFLGGHSSRIVGERAIGQTRMQILQRAPVDGVECDVVCTGRFYDFFEKRNGRWGLVYRQPIYEKDRIDPLDPSATLKLDEDLLLQFPVGYRHLAYLQSRLGFNVKRTMPGLIGGEVQRLYEKGDDWLANRAGHPIEW